MLKGAFLALLLYAAMQRPGPLGALAVAGCMVAGLAVSLGVAAGGKLRGGASPRGRWLSFVLFLLLESPRLVYAGVLVGLMVGIACVRSPASEQWLLPAFVAAGLAAGVGLTAMRRLPNRRTRTFVGLAVAAAVGVAAYFTLDRYPDLIPETDRRTLGVYLLLGLPFFYLLTFAGEAEESEADVAAWCAAVGVGTALIWPTANAPAFAVILPAAIYYAYTTRVLPGLRVFKHALRGMSLARMGRTRPALVLLRRATELDPQHALARDVLWDIHRSLEPAQLVADPELRALVDPGICLDRAAALLADRPTPAQLGEANHLLDLVAGQAPNQAAAVAYWRAVAHSHGHRLADAAADLDKLFDPTAWPADDPARERVLYPAWRLALVLHPGLRSRVGDPQLSKPGRRLDAIRATERALIESPADADALELKRVLYAGLTEADVAGAAPDAFDAAHVRELGRALLGDPVRRSRGLVLLRVAATGAAGDAPAVWLELADLGDATALESAARVADVAALTDAGRHAYFAALKRLADAAPGDPRRAIGYLQRYTAYERAGVETYRQLAELHEQAGDPLGALRANEQALVYQPKDADLLERRDRYHYSVEPATLAGAPDPLVKAVSVDYCVTKAKDLLDGRDLDADLLAWADHLAALAHAIDPANVQARTLLGRTALLRGDRDAAVARLETVRTPKPSTFPFSGDQEAYFLACRLLGDLYLNEFDDPAKAAECFAEFRTSSKSGADTLYKLGVAHERLGDEAQAAKWYKQVTAFAEHPRASDARAALHRLSVSA